MAFKEPFFRHLGWRNIGFLIVGFVLVSCGSSPNLSITYQLADAVQPSLVVLVTADNQSSSNTDTVVNTNGVQFNTPLNYLKACSLYFGWLRADTQTGGLAANRATCNDLAATYKNLVNQIELPGTPYNPAELKLQNQDSGYVFVITFFNVGAGGACMHLAAREIQSKEFFDAQAGSRSSTFNFTMSSQTLGLTDTDQTKCLPLP